MTGRSIAAGTAATIAATVVPATAIAAVIHLDVVGAVLLWLWAIVLVVFLVVGAVWAGQRIWWAAYRWLMGR